MKAIRRTQYGSPDVLRIEEIDKPTPTGDQVLVEVRSASVNKGDWHVLTGTPFLVRMMYGLFAPRDHGLGMDLAGRIEAVGPEVTGLSPGDEVYGEGEMSAFAEYASVSEHVLSRKPANLTFAEAAAVPVAGVTALQALRKVREPEPGDRVLVNGASGGVGTFAVQIAKAFGATVTGVSRTEKVDLVHSLGADRVIDYTKEDVTERPEQYDLILDAGAYRSIAAFRDILTPNGAYVLIGGSGQQLIQAMLTSWWLSEKNGRRFELLLAEPGREDLEELTALIESGQVRPVIDRRFSLEEVPEAIRYLTEGRAQGKLVVTVSKDAHPAAARAERAAELEHE